MTEQERFEICKFQQDLSRISWRLDNIFTKTENILDFCKEFGKLIFRLEGLNFNFEKYLESIQKGVKKEDE